jgi:hypothetical protein
MHQLGYYISEGDQSMQVAFLIDHVDPLPLSCIQLHDDVLDTVTCTARYDVQLLFA